MEHICVLLVSPKCSSMGGPRHVSILAKAKKRGLEETKIKNHINEESPAIEIHSTLKPRVTSLPYWLSNYLPLMALILANLFLSPPIPSLSRSPLLFSRHSRLTTFCSNNCQRIIHLSPFFLPKNRNLTRRPVKLIKSQLRYPIISPEDHWGIWTALFATGAFGLWYATLISYLACSIMLVLLFKRQGNKRSGINFTFRKYSS